MGLASDGFNLFGLQSSGLSTWHVVLMSHNLPPWLCMKQPFIILSLLIPGKYAPSNNIDVYLDPLIDDLKALGQMSSKHMMHTATEFHNACSYTVDNS